MLTFSTTSGNTIGNAGDAFAIGTRSAAITVATTLDHETTSTFILTVQVFGGISTADASITINVISVQDKHQWTEINGNTEFAPRDGAGALVFNHLHLI